MNHIHHLGIWLTMPSTLLPTILVSDLLSHPLYCLPSRYLTYYPIHFIAHHLGIWCWAVLSSSTWTVLAPRTVPTAISVSCRPRHHLEVNALLMILQQSQLCRPECLTDCSIAAWLRNHISASDYGLGRIWRYTKYLITLYYIESLLDSLIPGKPVTCHRRLSDYWFDKECWLNKRWVQQLECIAHKSETPDATFNWITDGLEYRSLRDYNFEAKFATDSALIGLTLSRPRMSVS